MPYRRFCSQLHTVSNAQQMVESTALFRIMLVQMLLHTYSDSRGEPVRMVRMVEDNL